jgi:RimJ/RimL family protein N-acetyltransferase
MVSAIAFPPVEIVTDRLLLRAYELTDAAENLLLFDDEESRRWTPAPDPYTREDSDLWCGRVANLARTSGDGLNWAATDGETGRLVGSFGLKHTDWQARVTEVGYLVAPFARGQGIASEGLAAISRWVLYEQGFHRLQLTVAVENHASHRVARKCGFVKEGVLRQAGYTSAGQVDLVMYGLLPEDLRLADAR